MAFIGLIVLTVNAALIEDPVHNTEQLRSTIMF
jgi:hypothetical protein